MRIGMGYDIHRLVSGRRLVLGGVEIPHEKGLLGHSDADVLTHALCDALLGAAGLGDIGIHFPDTDPEWAGIDSLKILQRVSDMIAPEWGVANIDVTVLAQALKSLLTGKPCAPSWPRCWPSALHKSMSKPPQPKPSTRSAAGRGLPPSASSFCTRTQLNEFMNKMNPLTPCTQCRASKRVIGSEYL